MGRKRKDQILDYILLAFEILSLTAFVIGTILSAVGFPLLGPIIMAVGLSGHMIVIFVVGFRIKE